MASKEIKPNMRCRIIGSINGPKGSSVGRICITVELIRGVPHTLWGPMWLVESADGLPFLVKHEDQTEYKHMRCAAARDWLEPLEDDPEPLKEVERETELTD